MKFLGRRLLLSLGAWGVLAITLSLMAALAPAATIDDKRAQAAEVAAQVDRLDAQLNDLQERVRYAKVELRENEQQVESLERQLEKDRKRIQDAEQRLMDRLVSLYQSGANATELLNLTTAGSFAELLDRLDAARFVSDQDQDLVGELTGLRQIAADRRAETDAARAEQQEIVDRAAKNARRVEENKAEREQVLGELEADIRAMVEAERAAAAERARRESEAAAAQADPVAAAEAPAEESAPPPTGEEDPGAVLAPPALPAASGAAAQAASIALQFVGQVPYKWGGSSPSEGFDCSGLVMYAFGQVGISLPHSSYTLWNAGPRVPIGSLQPGDLVFKYGLGHVGIYIGGGSYVHAPQSGRKVEVSSVSGGFVGGVRIA